MTTRDDDPSGRQRRITDEAESSIAPESFQRQQAFQRPPLRQQGSLSSLRNRAASGNLDQAVHERPEIPPLPPYPHKVSREQYPEYPVRAEVPDNKVYWNVEYEGYSPVEYTAEVVQANGPGKGEGWADPEEVPRRAWADPNYSHCGKIELDANGRPLNPAGRTGMCGRGLLGRWGVNRAADPIVTRRHPQTGQLQMVAVKRMDTREWAIPGGMVLDSDHDVSETLRRHFMEESVGERLAFDPGTSG